MSNTSFHGMNSCFAHTLILRLTAKVQFSAKLQKKLCPTKSIIRNISLSTHFFFVILNLNFYFYMIQNLSKTKLSVLSALKRKKIRLKEKIFQVEGSKSVLEFIKGDFSLNLIVATDKWWTENKISVCIPEENCLFATDDQLKKLSSLSTPPQVIAYFDLPDNPIIPSPNPDNLYLLLDGIQDPGNLGTIIRTADWFGVNTIYASHDTVDIFNPKTIMSTMGSLNRVKVFYTNLYNLIENNPQIPVFGTLLDGKNIYTQSLNPKGFVIMGNEGNGISDILRPLISTPLHIPPRIKTSSPESLNVAIATGIVLSEMTRSSLK